MDKSKWIYGVDVDPPKWLVNEFRRALRMMSARREVIHLFDVGIEPSKFTFIISLVPAGHGEKMAADLCAIVMGSTDSNYKSVGNFQQDFCMPALKGIASRDDCMRIVAALDCAVCYGALEALGDNPTLKNKEILLKLYQDRVERLKAMP